jgi:hypothetical protein
MRNQSITRLISFQKHDEKTTVFRDQCFQEFGPCTRFSKQFKIHIKIIRNHYPSKYVPPNTAVPCMCVQYIFCMLYNIYSKY